MNTKYEPLPSDTVCWQTEEFGWPIMLTQSARNYFTVIYGKQVKSGLSYENAARELGYALMHALACSGKLDNREDGED